MGDDLGRVRLALPEPLELDPDLHADEIEDIPATPDELDAPVRRRVSLAARSA